MNSSTKIIESWPPKHHAHIICSSSLSPSELSVMLDLSNHETDYIYQKEFDTFKIGDAHKIRDLQHERSNDAKVFILKFQFANTLSQNALLKILEEPSENSYFFLISSSQKDLLPTLQSRLEPIVFENNLQEENPLDYKEFLNLPLDLRLEYISKFTDKNKKSKNEKADSVNEMDDNKDTEQEDTDDESKELISKKQIFDFFNNIENHFESQQRGERRTRVINTINDARGYLKQDGSSKKLILNLVAVNID